MGVTSYGARYAQRRLARKMVRVMPILGVLVVIGTVAAAIRRKGVINGTVDTALDLTPFVGFVKNAVEAFRGRDLIADRPAGPRQPGMER